MKPYTLSLSDSGIVSSLQNFLCSLASFSIYQNRDLQMKLLCLAFECKHGYCFGKRLKNNLQFYLFWTGNTFIWFKILECKRYKMKNLIPPLSSSSHQRQLNFLHVLLQSPSAFNQLHITSEFVFTNSIFCKSAL